MRFINITNPGSVPADGDTVEFKIGDEVILDSYDFNLLQSLLNMIDQEEVDIISKTEFRDLFTFTEQISIDNAMSNPALTAEQKMIFASVTKSFSDADTINMSNSKVIMGTRFFADTPIGTTPGCGLITAARAEEILKRNYGVVI